MDIREIRAFTGLSQAKFGEKYKIPQITISQWESGKRKPPAYVINMLEFIVLNNLDYNKDK
ncbi:MAG: helix-turn-helix domain-containing protein [Fusobacterium periodonticum]|nr:helix-turn-helix domain-containing protein [Fusobacterium periodonticum]